MHQVPYTKSKLTYYLKPIDIKWFSILLSLGLVLATLLAIIPLSDLSAITPFQVRCLSHSIGPCQKTKSKVLLLFAAASAVEHVSDTKVNEPHCSLLIATCGRCHSKRIEPHARTRLWPGGCRRLRFISQKL